MYWTGKLKRTSSDVWRRNERPLTHPAQIFCREHILSSVQLPFLFWTISFFFLFPPHINYVTCSLPTVFFLGVFELDLEKEIQSLSRKCTENMGETGREAEWQDFLSLGSALLPAPQGVVAWEYSSVKWAGEIRAGPSVVTLILEMRSSSGWTQNSY